MLEVDKKTFEPSTAGRRICSRRLFGDGCVPCQALMPHIHSYAERNMVTKLNSHL